MGKVIGKYATEGEMLEELTEYGEQDKADGYTVEFLTEYSFVARCGRETKVYTAYSYTEGKSVSYTHLRAHETVLDLVCRLLLEKKNNTKPHEDRY